MLTLTRRVGEKLIIQKYGRVIEVKVISAFHESRAKILVTGEESTQHKHRKSKHENRTFNANGRKINERFT